MAADRISALPEPLLHNILSSLSQKEAVRTCILSKSWRYLGSTRPNIEFLYRDYINNQTHYLSILEKTLHMYDDEKLCVKDFHVEFRTNDTESVSFLENWFPIIVATMSGAKTFNLSFRWRKKKRGYFDLPEAVFENSKTLQNLRLRGFTFSHNLEVHNLKHLQALTLEDVHIVDETFQKIMSSCPYIERLVLSRCEGLTKIRLMNNSLVLKNLGLVCSQEHGLKEDLCFLDVPNLESMKIGSCCNWFDFDRHRKIYFPGLKSLELTMLRLSTRPSLDILSRDFPCLQYFYIHDCIGFGQMRVLNHSIKKLTISCLDDSIKVVVDAPNLVLLDYELSLPQDISFATTTRKCVSNIKPPAVFNVRSEVGYLKLSKLLKAVSQSKIYLLLPLFYDSSDEDYEDDNDYHDKPVPVEQLNLECVGHHEFFYSEDFLNRIFRYCRPRSISEWDSTWHSQFLCRMLLLLLLLRQNKLGSPWQRDLKEASMQVWDQNNKEWHSVEWITFLDCADCNNYKGEVRFKLNWRE